MECRLYPLWLTSEASGSGKQSTLSLYGTLGHSRTFRTDTESEVGDKETNDHCDIIKHKCFRSFSSLKPSFCSSLKIRLSASMFQ